MGPLLIVEVEGYDGETGQITVSNDLESTDRLYCVGRVGDDGVVRFVDWGYATIDEAREAWPKALSTGTGLAQSGAMPGQPAR